MQNFANGGYRDFDTMKLPFFMLEALKNKTSRMVAMTNSQNFANGGYRDFATMKLPFFMLEALTLRKKSKFIFTKLREWWPWRIRHHESASFPERDA